MSAQRFGAEGPEPGLIDAPYWDGLRAGELRIQRCGQLRALDLDRASRCARTATPSTPAGKPSRRTSVVYTWTRTWNRFHPTAESPYTTVLVELPQAGGQARARAMDRRGRPGDRRPHPRGVRARPGREQLAADPLEPGMTPSSSRASEEVWVRGHCSSDATGVVAGGGAVTVAWRGAVAAVGVGQTPYYKRGRRPAQHEGARARGAARRRGRRRRRPAGDRRLRILGQRPVRGHARGHHVGRARTALVLDGLGRGRRRPGSRDPAGCRGDRHRPGVLRRGLPGDEPGRGRPLAVRQGPFPEPLRGARDPHPGPGVRAADPTDDRARQGAGLGAGGPRTGRVPPRADQPAARSRTANRWPPRPTGPPG